MMLTRAGFHFGETDNFSLIPEAKALRIFQAIVLRSQRLCEFKTRLS